MQRATILARFAAKAGFLPQDELDNIVRQFQASPDSKRLNFEAWAVTKGFMGMTQAQSLVEALQKSRFLCLNCTQESFGKDLAADKDQLRCPHCQYEELRLQGTAGMSPSGAGEQRATSSRAPRAPKLSGSGNIKDSHPDAFEDEGAGGTIEFGVAKPDPLAAAGWTDFGSAPLPPPPPPPKPETARKPAPPPPAQSAQSGRAPNRPSGSGATDDTLEITPQMLDRGLPEGVVLEGFKIVKVVGRGGIGIVYKGLQPQLDRYVALKVLSPNVLQDDTQRTRFQLEAKAMAKLEHPNIVQVYAFGEKFGRPYIAMQWVDGESMGQMIDSRGPLPVTKVIDYGIQSARGLGEAHRFDIVHRDVKPDNLIITPQGVVKIVDFGLAKQAGSDLMLSDPNFVLGTPAYIAPEQALGQPIDARTDIYSLAITLYHALTGEIPFDGPAGTVVHKHIQQPLPSPREKVPEIPKELDDLIKQMASKVPNQRPKTMAEVVERLEDIQRMMKRPATGAGNKAGTALLLQDLTAAFPATEVTNAAAAEPALPVAPTPQGAVSFDQLAQAATLPVDPLTAEFKPIEEIEFSVEKGSKPGAPPAVKQATPAKTGVGIQAKSPTPKPADVLPDVVLPATHQQPVPPKPSFGAPSTKSKTAEHTPAPTEPLQISGAMKGRKQGALETGSTGKAEVEKVAAASTPTAQPAPAPAASNDAPAAAMQILGGDFVDQLAKLHEKKTRKAPVTSERKTPWLLIGFLMLLLLGGSVGGIAYFMTLETPEEKEMNELIAQVMMAPPSKWDDLHAKIESFAQKYPQLAAEEKFTAAKTRLEANILNLAKELELGAGESLVAKMNAVRESLETLRKKCATFTAENLSPEAEKELDSLRLGIANADKRVVEATDYIKGVKFKLLSGFEAIIDLLRAEMRAATEVLESADKVRIDRKQQDENRVKLIAECKTLLGARFDVEDITTPIPNLDIAKTRDLRKRIDALRTLGRFKNDSELRRCSRLLGQALRLADVVDDAKYWLDVVLARLPAETQLAEINAKTAKDSDLAQDRDVQIHKKNVEEAIRESRERAQNLMTNAAKVTRQSQLSDAADLVASIEKFFAEPVLNQPLLADRPRLETERKRLAELVTVARRNQETYDDLRRRAETLDDRDGDTALAHELAASELLPELKAFDGKAPHLDVKPFIHKTERVLAKAAEERANRAAVAGIKQTAEQAVNRDQAEAQLRAIDEFLARPRYSRYANEFQTLKRSLRRMVEWETFADPPRYGANDEFSWHARRLAQHRDLALTAILTDYRLPGHRGSIDQAVFAPTDPTKLLTTGDDGYVRLWDSRAVETEWRCIGRSPGTPFPGIPRAVFRTEKQAYVSAGGNVHLIDLERRAILSTFTGPSAGVISSLALSPDGAWLAAGYDTGHIRLFSTTDPNAALPPMSHALRVTKLAFYPADPAVWTKAWREDKRNCLVISSSKDKSIRVWRVSDGSRKSELAHDSGGVNDFCVVESTQHLISVGDDSKLYLWALQTGAIIRAFETHRGAVVTGVAFSILNNQPRAITCGADGLVRTWDTVDGKAYATIDCGRGPLVFLTLKPGGTNTLLVGTKSGGLFAVSLDNNRVLDTVETHAKAINGLASNGQLLATIGKDGVACVWRMADRAKLASFTLDSGITGFAGGGISQTLAVIVTTDGRVLFVNLQNGREDGRISDPVVPEASCAAVSPDGKTLLVGDARQIGRVVVVDLTTRKPSGELTGIHPGVVTSLAFSRDSQLALTGSRGRENDQGKAKAALWNVAARTPIHVFNGINGDVYSVAFVDDDKGAAVGSGTFARTGNKGDAQVFNLASGLLTHNLINEGASPVFAIASVGNKVLCATADGSLLLLRLNISDSTQLLHASLQDAGDDVRSLVVVPNTKTLVAGTARGAVLVFEVAD